VSTYSANTILNFPLTIERQAPHSGRAIVDAVIQTIRCLTAYQQNLAIQMVSNEDHARRRRSAVPINTSQTGWFHKPAAMKAETLLHQSCSNSFPDASLVQFIRCFRKTLRPHRQVCGKLTQELDKCRSTGSRSRNCRVPACLFRARLPAYSAPTRISVFTARFPAAIDLNNAGKPLSAHSPLTKSAARMTPSSMNPSARRMVRGV
jgi:hypothetical protein